MSRWAKINLIITAIILIFSCVIGIYLSSYIISDFRKFEFDIKLIVQTQTLIISGIIFIILECLMLINDKGSTFKRLGKAKTIDVGLENSHFQDEKEQKKNFTITNYKNLHKRASGVVLGAKKAFSKEIKVVVAKAIHALIIGNTGSGKTSTFVIPQILLLSQFKDKPSMIIADPKGELFEKTSNELQKKGYKIHVIDLIKPLISTKWNPLTIIYDNYQLMLKCEENSIEQKELLDTVFSDVNELVLGLFPIKNKEEPMWEEGRNSFIEGIILGMLEDSGDPSNGMTREKFNFDNVRNISNMTENECQDLKIYFAKKSKYSKAKEKANTVLSVEGKTLASYLTTIKVGMSIFSDVGLCEMMSFNEIDFNNFDNEPTALYLKIPDEKQGRYSIASAFFNSTYRTLVAKARNNEGSKLNKPLYFIIDEFGNMPQIPQMDKMLAVSRSREIFFMLIVQSYEQLENVYGRVAAGIIRENCNIEGFIGSKEIGTLEEFSKKCGNKTIISSSVTSSPNSDGSANVSVRSEPIIYPYQLKTLNNGINIFGNIVWIISGLHPVKLFFTPYFNCSSYNIGQAQIQLTYSTAFDSKKNYYDINKEDWDFNSVNEIELNEQNFSTNEVEEPELGGQLKEIKCNVTRHLTELDVANNAIITELLRIQDYIKISELISEAIEVAKQRKDVHRLAVLRNELSKFEKLAKLNDINAV